MAVRVAARKAYRRCLLDRTTHEDDPGLRGYRVPPWEDFCERGFRRSVQHKPERTLVAVLEHEYNRAVEVRIEEIRGCHEESAFEGVHNCAILAGRCVSHMLRVPPRTPLTSDPEPVDTSASTCVAAITPAATD